MVRSLRLCILLVGVSLLAWLPASSVDACPWCRWHRHHQGDSGGSYDRPDSNGGTFTDGGEDEGERAFGAELPASQEALNRAVEQALGRAMQSRQFDSRTMHSRAMSSRAAAVESRAAGIELGLALAQLLLSQGGAPSGGLLGGFSPEAPPQAPPAVPATSEEIKALRQDIATLQSEVTALVGAFEETTKHSKALRADVDRLLENAGLERSIPPAEGDQDANQEIKPKQ